MAVDRQEPGRESAASPLRAALLMLARLKPEPPIDIGGFDADWRRSTDIFDDTETLERLLAAQAAFTVDLDRKAQAAYLVNEHSLTLATVLVAPLIGQGVAPDIAPAHVGLRFGTRTVTHRGRVVEDLTTALRLETAAFTTHDVRWTDHPDARFVADRSALLDHARRQIEDYFRPLIARLHRLTGLPANAMWRLVGDSVSAVFLEAGRNLGCEDLAKETALTILKHPGSPLTNRQMHFFDLVIRDPEDEDHVLLARSFRSRGGCCRYYTSVEGKLCTTCVLRDPIDRDRNLETVIRARLGSEPHTH